MIARRRVRARLALARPAPGVTARAGELVARFRAYDGPTDRAGTAAFGAVAGAVALVTSVPAARAAPAAALGLSLGWRAGEALFDRQIHARAQAIRRALPTMLDRLTTCVLAGMTIERALRLVIARTDGPLRDAVEEGLRALDVGARRADAYARIAAAGRCDDLTAVMGSLARAERYGTPVATTLTAMSEEMRARARAAAEAEARTVPVKLVFPLVFCFLPAFVVLAIAPIALSAVRTLGGL